MMKTTNPNQNLPKPGRIEIIGFFLMVLSLALASCRQQATPTATAPPTAAPAAACQLVSQTPPDNSVLAADTDYNFTWVIKNTSTTKWDQSEYDVVFVSSSAGGSIHSGPDTYDLPSTIEPGQTVTISGTGKTPINLGPYTETWAIAQGNKIVCPFDVTVQVQ
jgi:hypothetical protein